MFIQFIQFVINCHITVLNLTIVVSLVFVVATWYYTICASFCLSEHFGGGSAACIFVSVTFQRYGITDYMVSNNRASLSLCNTCGYSRLFMYSCRSHFSSIKGASGRQLMYVCMQSLKMVFQSSVWVHLLVLYQAGTVFLNTK